MLGWFVKYSRFLTGFLGFWLPLGVDAGMLPQNRLAICRLRAVRNCHLSWSSFHFI